MESTQSLKFAGDVSIDKVQVVSSKGFFQDITAQVMTVQYYEQFLVYNLLKFYGIKIKFLYNKTPFPDTVAGLTYNALIRNKFLHLDAYYREVEYKQAINILYGHIIISQIDDSYKKLNLIEKKPIL